MTKWDDLRGQVFGRLIVNCRASSSGGAIRWLCDCQCGKQTIATSSNLKLGKVKSCGCLRVEKNLQKLGGFRRTANQSFTVEDLPESWQP